YVAGRYTDIGQKDKTELLLQDVLKLDPMHPPASNDLGYYWADAGKNLEEAERLIRVALQGEPDNGAFLDSLGWVLYKRGKFAEARKYFEDAVAPSTLPDPVVLDHLGDSLYRLGRRDDALRQWRRSWDRLSQQLAMQPDRQDLKDLRTALQQKIKAAGS